jgi:hypothetical protein
MGVIAGLAGAALMIGGSAMSAGKKVRVPEFRRVNTEKEQEAAIKQNIASLQGASELATKTTAAEQTLLESQLRRAIPGYDQLISQASSNIGSALRGELSPEATRNLQRFSAGQALTRGYGGGSGMGLFGAVQNYAKASEARQQLGLAQAQNFIQQQRAFGMVQPFSVSSMFISPTQRINLALQENQSQYNRDMAAAQVAAQPDPMMAAIGGSLSNIGGMAFGAGMGGMMGGGGGQGGGGGGGFTINMGGGGYGNVGYNPYGSYQPNLYSAPRGYSPYGGYNPNSSTSTGFGS